jgi:DNA-binding MarR family transcriptional regulator
MSTLTLLRRADRLDANGSLPARLMAVTHFLQKQAMDRLLLNPRYGKLSLAYAPYIVLLIERDRSPGEIAGQLGISKQACGKTLQELRALELIRGRVNPQDSRSRVLSLSAKGVKLVRDGVEAAQEIQQHMAEAVGVERLRQLTDVLNTLCVAMDAELPARADAIESRVAAKVGSRSTRLLVLLCLLSSLFHRRLKASIGQQHSDLRPGVGQLLGLISEEGRRLQYIASLLGISKQAVAVAAADLEQLGYARREEDAEDRRQTVVSLTARGQKLLLDVVAAVDAMEGVIRKVLGDAGYQLLDDAITSFHSKITEQYDSAGQLRARIQQLSRQMVDELGTTGARALAQQLTSITRGKS